MYSEAGVLEKMHSASFFVLMREQDPDILKLLADQVISNLIKNKENEFKQIFVYSILATDMAEHGRLAQNFKNRLEATRYIENGTDCPEFIKDFAFNINNFSDRRVSNFN